MSDLTLTIYQADDETPHLEVGTAADHPHPYLQEPEAYAESEIDLIEGTARIGRYNIGVIDIQTGATQAERWLTALLGDAEGHSQLNGRRARLAHSDGTVVIDGICAGVRLHDSYAGFVLALEDIRARGIEVEVFSRADTATVLPRGVLSGYGRLPTGEWLVPPTEPLRARFRASDQSFDLSSHWQGHYTEAPEVDARLVATPQVLEALQPTQITNIGQAALYRYGVQVGWRRSAHEPWTWTNPTGPRVLERYPARVNDDPVSAVWRIIALNFFGPWPNEGEDVDVLIRYLGPPSDAYPFHWEGIAGELLLAALRGEFSWRQDDGTWQPVDPRIRVDEDAFIGAAAPDALRQHVRIRITEPVEDLREWISDACRDLGVAPALDAEGRISPVGQQLPPAGVPLAEVNDVNAEPHPGWEHPITSAVTQVEIEYPRDYRVPPDADPTGDRSAGDGLASVRQKITVRPEDATVQQLMGVHHVRLGGDLFRALGGTEGEPAVGDVIQEDGARAAHRRAHELLDRAVYGMQTDFVRVRRSDPAMAALRVGDWVVDGRSWSPNYSTGRRGRNHLTQVVSIRDVNLAWRELRLVDAAPHANPAAQPTIGDPTASSDGVVSVPVTAIPAGVEARLDYAVSETVPDTGSPLWTYLGRTGSIGTLSTPPLPAGARVWIRARGEKEGRRPSAWTTPIVVTAESIPRALSSVASINPPSVRWRINGAAAGVRVYYAVHNSGAEPAFDAHVDAPASAGMVVLGIQVPAGMVLTVEVEPWTEWAGTAVSGSPGERYRTSARAPSGDSLGLSLDLSVDPATGAPTLVVGTTSPEVRSWRVRVAISSVQADGWEAPEYTDSDPMELSGSDFGARIPLPGSVGTGQAVYVEGHGYVTAETDAAAQQSARRSLRVRAWEARDVSAPDALPILDRDSNSVVLYPNRNALSGSVRYAVRTDRPPTEAEVQAGTVLTGGSVEVYVWDPSDGEVTVYAGVIPYANADGTGAAGALRNRQRTMTTEAEGPALTWQPIRSGDPDEETIELIATDDSDEVAVYYRTYPAGAAPPAFTRAPASGWGSDPCRVPVTVTVPDEGAPDILLEAYAADADGATSDRIVLAIDADAQPSGTFALEVDTSGRVWVIANTTDPDSGSWRARVRVGSFQAVQYANTAGGTTWEGAGSTWGARVDTGIVLEAGQEPYLTGHFYRTLSALAASQQVSRRSREQRVFRGREPEPEPTPDPVAVDAYFEPWGGFQGPFSIRVYTELPAGTTRVRYIYSSQSHSGEYYRNVSGTEHVENLRNSADTAVQTWAEKEETYLRVIFHAGTESIASQALNIRPEVDSYSVRIRTAGGTTYEGAALTASTGLAAGLSAGLPALSINRSATDSWYRPSSWLPTPGEIGASPVGHTHDERYLRLTGGALTGALRAPDIRLPLPSQDPYTTFVLGGNPPSGTPRDGTLWGVPGTPGGGGGGGGQVLWADVLSPPVYTQRWPAWGEVTGKPVVFPPEAVGPGSTLDEFGVSAGRAYFYRHSAGNAPSDAPFASRGVGIHMAEGLYRAQIHLATNTNRMFFRGGTTWDEVASQSWASDQFLSLSGGRVVGNLEIEAGRALTLRRYEFWSEFSGAGSDSSRLWIDAPDGGEVIIGPRAGAAYLYRVRLRGEVYEDAPDAAGNHRVATRSWTNARFLPLGGGTLTGDLVAPHIEEPNGRPYTSIVLGTGTPSGTIRDGVLWAVPGTPGGGGGGTGGQVLWADVLSKPETATRWPRTEEITPTGRLDLDSSNNATAMRYATRFSIYGTAGGYAHLGFWLDYDGGHANTHSTIRGSALRVDAAGNLLWQTADTTGIGATTLTTRWEIQATTGRLLTGIVPWDRLESLPAYATRWPTPAEAGATPASHATDTNNPHAVTASQVGASPVGHDHDDRYGLADQNLRTTDTVAFRGVHAGGEPITGGFGARATSGTLDWNDVSNARSGQGFTLLMGTAPNGPGGSYYHPFSFEYSGSKVGGGNLTQFAIPYNTSSIAAARIRLRSRYGGDWSDWYTLATEQWADSKFLPLGGGTLTGLLTAPDIEDSQGRKYASVALGGNPPSGILRDGLLWAVPGTPGGGGGGGQVLWADIVDKPDLWAQGTSGPNLSGVNIDLDDARGFHAFYAQSSSLNRPPIGNANIIGWGLTNYEVQLASRLHRMFWRTRNAGTWGNWIEVASQDWVAANTRSNTWMPTAAQVGAAPSTHTHTWAQVSKTGSSLADLATRAITDTTGNLPWSRLSSVPATATSWPTWGQVTGKPTSFPPSSHTHDDRYGLSNQNLRTTDDVTFASVKNAYGHFYTPVVVSSSPPGGGGWAPGTIWIEVD